MKHKIFVLIFAIVLIASLGSWALACSCVRNLPCESYQDRDVIFVGKLVEKKRIEDSIFNHKFEILESFKGIKSEKYTQVIANEEESICGYKFNQNETYLVYAGKTDKGKLATGLCSRTRLFSRAQEDLNYLRNLSDKTEGKIFGIISEKLSFRKDEEVKPFANLPLKIVEIGNEQKTYETVTDENGKYEIDVAAGNYEIIPVIPNYAQISDERNSITKIEVQTNGCKSADFIITNKGQITGKLLLSDGKPIGGIDIELIDSETGEWVTDVESEPDGSFKFEKVPTGKYVLAVNKNLSPHAEAPFPTTYFSQTSDVKKAKIIEIGYGQNSDQILF